MKNFKISTKLIIVGLTIGILSSGIIGILSISQSTKALEIENFEKIEALSGLKKQAIEDFYSDIINAIESYSKTLDVELLAEKLEEYAITSDLKSSDNINTNTEEYKAIREEFEEHIHNLAESGGYYDLFIIDAEHGHIMYTDAQESDLGENLKTGKLAKSHIAKVWKGAIAKDDYFISDLEPYAPSENMPAQFIAHPIKNDQGQIYAVLALQIPDALINEIMTDRLGLGETGEAYLVGNDFKMRSNSRFQENAVLKTELKSETMHKALNGQSGIEVVKDYRGVEVISAYNKINVEGLNWVILTEIDESEAIEAATSLRDFIILIIVIMIIGVVIGTWLVAKSIAKPVEQAAEFAETIANGDLTKTIEIDQNDEIGKMAAAMSKMSFQLKEIITSIILGADNIAGASQQISSSSQQMSQGASEQASSVEEISSTMEEMASNIQQNTDNAQQTEKIANVAHNGIKEVSQQSENTVIANKNISEKISIVQDIAFQTNILALNAAVEAARAGENGKGFAVVAAEVRKLAERSKIAAEEIVTLANNSLQMAESAGDKMGKILPEVVKTAQLVKEIASASTEQNNGAGQVNNAIQQLSNVTQQNAAASEELATSAEEMSSQAEQLKELISFFKVDNLERKNSLQNREKLKYQESQALNIKKHQNLKGITIDMDESHDSDFEKF